MLRGEAERASWRNALRAVPPYASLLDLNRERALAMLQASPWKARDRSACGRIGDAVLTLVIRDVAI